MSKSVEDQPEMIRATREVRHWLDSEARLPSPRCALIEARSNFHRGPSRSLPIAHPVHHAGSATRFQYPPCLLQQRHRFFQMENIENHGVIAALCRKAGSTGDEVANGRFDVGQTLGSSLASSSFNHFGIDIECVHNSRDAPCCVDRKEPVPAAELDDVFTGVVAAQGSEGGG